MTTPDVSMQQPCDVLQSQSSLQSTMCVCDADIWDTAGQDRFNSMHASYYFKAHCCIMVRLHRAVHSSKLALSVPLATQSCASYSAASCTFSDSSDSSCILCIAFPAETERILAFTGCAVQVFDCTRKVTYKNLEKWWTELQSFQPGCPTLPRSQQIDADPSVTSKSFGIRHQA